MTQKRFRDPIKAKAAIAHLIAEGWKIDLHTLHKTLPGGIQDQDWMELANHCLDIVLEAMGQGQVIPIEPFLKREPR